MHDLDFQLDGDISAIDQNPGGPGTPTTDWVHLFDVSGTAVPTPKDPLPTDFIQATFARDFVPGASGPDRTTFTTGSKDTLNITPGWQCARDNNVNDKTDLVNVYATAYSDPGSGDLILYLGLERFSNEGAGNVSFWILQDDTVDCIAPASGPSTTSFTGNHEDGDILVVSEFTNGGVVSNIKAYRWDGGAGGSLNPTAVASGVDCKTELAGDDICATVNTTSFMPPWLTETKQPGPTPSNDLDVSEFFEAGVNIDELGLGGRCFNRILADTRSAPSLTATIFDYAIGSLPLCDLEVTKGGDTISKVGDDIDYTITIENTGGITLFKQSIVDSLLGDLTDGTNPLITSSDCSDSLAPGDSCTINVTRTVEAGDPDPLPNTVTVVYDSSDDLLGDEVTREDDHSVNLFQPSVTIDKTGDELSKVGDDITYTYTIENTSSPDSPNLILGSLADAGDNNNGAGLGDLTGYASYDPDCDELASGESCSFSITYTVIAGDDDPLDNTVAVHYHPVDFPNDITASDSHSVNLFQPSVTIDKTGDELSKVGDDVDYTITLSNTSSADTPDLTCTAEDTLLGTVFGPAVLPPGDTVLNLSRTVLEGDSDPLENTATLTCSPEGFPNVLEASDSHTVELFQPSITIDKTGDSLSKVGDDVDYTITLNNTSSADSPDLDCTITDPLLGIDEDVTLASGGNHVINTTYTVQAGDPDPLENTASASCSPEGFPNVLEASDSHTVELFQPSVTIDKTGDELSKVGDDVDYTITVNNTSSADSPNLDCTITDPLLGIAKNVNLAPGANDVTNTAYTVQEGDPDPLVNTASVICTVVDFGNVLGPISDSHSVNLFQPSVTVDKTGPAQAGVGDTVTYSYVITNTGSADSPDLVLDSVVDDVVGDLTATANGAGCGTLASAASCNFTADYVIQAADPNPLVNVVTVHYHPDGFPNDITDLDDHSIEITAFEGCTPGFWQGGVGSTLWDDPSPDPEWLAHGGDPAGNPFTTETEFGDFFSIPAGSTIGDMTMLEVVGSGGGSDWARKAARDLVAAYLNASFGISYPYSTATIISDWDAAVALNTDAAFQAFHEKYAAANELGCPL